MRYMMFVKSAQDRGRPPQALIAAIDKLATAARNEGRMLGGGELGPLRDGARVCLAGGNITVLESPPSGKDVIAGYVQLEFGFKEDAIASATSSWKCIVNTGLAGKARRRSVSCSRRVNSSPIGAKVRNHPLDRAPSARLVPMRATATCAACTRSEFERFASVRQPRRVKIHYGCSYSRDRSVGDRRKSCGSRSNRDSSSEKTPFAQRGWRASAVRCAASAAA